MNKKFDDSHSFSTNETKIKSTHHTSNPSFESKTIHKKIFWLKHIICLTQNQLHWKKCMTTEKNLSEQKLFHWREILWYQTRKTECFNQDSVHDFMVLFKIILSINSVIYFDNFIFKVFIIFVELFLFIFFFFSIEGFAIFDWILPFSFFIFFNFGNLMNCLYLYSFIKIWQNLIFGKNKKKKN